MYVPAASEHDPPTVTPLLVPVAPAELPVVAVLPVELAAAPDEPPVVAVLPVEPAVAPDEPPVVAVLPVELAVPLLPLVAVPPVVLPVEPDELPPPHDKQAAIAPSVATFDVKAKTRKNRLIIQALLCTDSPAAHHKRATKSRRRDDVERA